MWSVWFSAEAKEDFLKLDRPVRVRIVEKLEWFAEHFNVTNLTSLVGDKREFLKLRIGDWRVLYAVDYTKHLIKVYVIDRRDKIYKRKI